MRRSPFVFALLVLLTPSFAVAAWPPNGARLTGARDDQAGPEIVSDGAGGAFVSWADWRNFGALNTGTDLYVQRVTAAGLIAPGWPVDGLAVAIGPETQGNEWKMAADGSGGLLIVYGDTRYDSGDLYLQRITAAGAVAPGWPVGGVPVGVGSGQQAYPELARDGAGGAWVSWQDLDASGGSSARFTHVLGSGQSAPGWPDNGRLFAPGSLVVNRPLLLATAQGGFTACWSTVEDAEFNSMHVYAMRYLADASEDPAWLSGGVTIGAQRSFPFVRLVSDASGGFFVLFDDYRNSPPGGFPFAEEDLYAQHVQGNGTLAPGWPADGLPVSAGLGVTEQLPDLCEDGVGGVFIAWEDYRSGYARVFAKHLGADGLPLAGWPAAGLSLTDRLAFQLSPKLAWDGVRGAYVVWMDLEASSYRSYVRHLTSGGASAPGWPANGLPVIPLETDQYVPRIVADGSGGAIVAWEDIRSAERDIYAQRFVTDGVVAAQVSVVLAEARADEVRLRWHVSGETRASVERSDGGAAEWRALAQRDVDGAGYIEYVDRVVAPGASYEYRLSFASGSHGGETSVTVPALELAFEGARPNPAVGALFVAFTLPDASAARLELYDLAGRRLAVRDVGARGAGRRVVRLDDGALTPGLYWTALTQGLRTLRARVAVVR